MCSNEDLGKILFQRQTEALPHGGSVQSFDVRRKWMTFSLYIHNNTLLRYEKI